MSAVVKPAEHWAPTFTKYFADDQIVKPTYALSTANGGGTWCKLCDSLVKGNADRHLAQHARDLKEWRVKRRAEADQAREQGLELRRAEKALEREVLGTGSSGTTRRAAKEGAITPERRAKNKVSSIRYKLNHPEKSGKPEWSKTELATLHKSLEDAVAAVDAIDPTQKKEAA